MPAFQSLGRLPLTEGRGKKKWASHFSSAKHSSFPRAHFIFLIFLLLHFYLLSYPPILSLPPPHSSLLTNLHILPFPRNVMHNPPLPFSSLSHLHPLVSFVGKSIPSIPSPICPCISNLTRFHGSFNFVTCRLRQVYDFLAAEAENPPQSLRR